MQIFDVTGMTCGHCVRAIMEAVSEVDPAASVQVDLKAGQARIDSALPASRLADAIREAGYEARAWEAASERR